jgi:glycogen debranching enzyme
LHLLPLFTSQPTASMQSLANKLANFTTSALSDAPSDSASQTVYLLPLTDSGAPDVPGTYIYLPPPTEPAYSVRFQIQGTSSICRQGSLWVNIPAKGEKFDRSKYREYKWVSPSTPNFPTTVY